MKKQDWYEKRERIAAAQVVLGPLIADLMKYTQDYVARWPPDPVTHNDAVAVQRLETGTGFVVIGPSGVTVTVSLPQDAEAILIGPAVNVNERLVSEVHRAAVDFGRVLVDVTATDGANVGVNLESLLTGLAEAVLT